MADCCEPDGYDEKFSDRFARRVARRYRRRGLSRSSRAIVSFLTERGIEGVTVLEIGGGVGEIQVELLRRGVARASNLETVTPTGSSQAPAPSPASGCCSCWVVPSSHTSARARDDIANRLNRHWSRRWAPGFTPRAGDRTSGSGGPAPSR
jgi:hypothetical protein